MGLIAVEGGDPAKRALLERRIKAVFRAGDFDIMTQLRRALRMGLLIGDISAVEIAAQIGTSERTLNRRLAGAQTNFQAALDQARFTLAKQLLGNTRISLGQIGEILRYNEASSFTRASFAGAG